MYYKFWYLYCKSMLSEKVDTNLFFENGIFCTKYSAIVIIANVNSLEMVLARKLWKLISAIWLQHLKWNCGIMMLISCHQNDQQCISLINQLGVLPNHLLSTPHSAPVSPRSSLLTITEHRSNLKGLGTTHILKLVN